MNLTIDGRQVQYLDKGEGPTLLFLHGWAAPVETYRLLTDHLSGYCRVVAPDFPGFGGSEEPPVPWDVDGYVDFTLKFAAALGIERAVLMGHSFGGRVIIKLMNRPGPPLEVPKIILMDAHQAEAPPVLLLEGVLLQGRQGLFPPARRALPVSRRGGKGPCQAGQRRLPQRLASHAPGDEPGGE